MTITEVRVAHVKDQGMVVAYATIVLNGSFAVHDLRLIKSGSKLIVAMPDRMNKYACQDCKRKCAANSNYCPNCGVKLIFPSDSDIRFNDIAHPITVECRRLIDKVVIDEYIRTVGPGRLLSAIHPSVDHASPSVSEPSQSTHHP